MNALQENQIKAWLNNPGINKQVLSQISRVEYNYLFDARMKITDDMYLRLKSALESSYSIPDDSEAFRSWLQKAPLHLKVAASMSQREFHRLSKFKLGNTKVCSEEFLSEIRTRLRHFYAELLR